MFLYISAVCLFRLPRLYTGHVPVNTSLLTTLNFQIPTQNLMSVSSRSRVNIPFPHSFPYLNMKIKIHFLLCSPYISFCVPLHIILIICYTNLPSPANQLFSNPTCCSSSLIILTQLPPLTPNLDFAASFLSLFRITTCIPNEHTSIPISNCCPSNQPTCLPNIYNSLSQWFFFLSFWNSLFPYSFALGPTDYGSYSQKSVRTQRHV